tara:strand:- start:49849 stop:50124 length:276 start_codon:yes stop_codon:yes gene_type:complete
MIFPQRAILDESNKSASFKTINPHNKLTTYAISLVDREQNNSSLGTTTINFNSSGNLVTHTIKLKPTKYSTRFLKKEILTTTSMLWMLETL